MCAVHPAVGLLMGWSSRGRWLRERKGGYRWVGSIVWNVEFIHFMHEQSSCINGWMAEYFPDKSRQCLIEYGIKGKAVLQS